jgi:hypothetical protein
MKTAIVQSSELGDDWTASAHMLRVLTQAQRVHTGDVIRVKDQRTEQEGPRWHTVTVTDQETKGTDTVLMTNKWPIAYVCNRDTLVELVEIKREVLFRCVICTRDDDHKSKTRRTVTLKDFVDTELQRAGGLHVVLLPDTEPRQQDGYCKDHGTNLLS